MEFYYIECEMQVKYRIECDYKYIALDSMTIDDVYLFSFLFDLNIKFTHCASSNVQICRKNHTLKFKKRKKQSDEKIAHRKRNTKLHINTHASVQQIIQKWLAQAMT